MNKYELLPQDRVLVLGRAGFVGKRLIPELVRKIVKLLELAPLWQILICFA